MRMTFRSRWSLLALLATANLGAQGGRVPPTPATPAPAATRGDPKKSLTIADYARWRSIRDVAISEDGNWTTYGYQQRKTDDTLVVKNLSSMAEQRIPRAARSQLSDDSHWVAY